MGKEASQQSQSVCDATSCIIYTGSNGVREVETMLLFLFFCAVGVAWFCLCSRCMCQVGTAGAMYVARERERERESNNIYYYIIYRGM